MGREELKQVFEETKRLYTTDKVLKDSIKIQLSCRGYFWSQKT